MWRSLFRFTLVCSGLAATPVLAQTEAKIEFLLNWTLGGDHIPYYFAQKAGLYQKASVHVEIVPGKGSGYSLQRVALGQNPVGIADMANVLQARGKGVALTAVMAIYANSAFGLYWQKSRGITSPQDLAGKTIGVPTSDAIRQIWPAIAQHLNIPPQSVSWVNVAPESKLEALKSGQIDFTSHFYNVHDQYQTEFGDDLGFVALRDVGFNPYGLVIIANPAYLSRNRPLVENFVHVTQQAFALCIADAEPCIDAMHEATNIDPNELRASWQRVITLMRNDTTETIALGYLDPDRIKADAQMIAEAFAMPPIDLAGSYTNAFLDTAIKMPR